MYRRDPVHGIRCRRGAGYGRKYLRYPATASEIRQYYSCPELARKGRSPRNLPNSWDDIYRESTFNYKNWKLYRKTQWK